MSKSGDEYKELGSLNEVREFLTRRGTSHSNGYYHYTNLSAWRGMLRSRNIHLSLGRMMNDLAEPTKGDTEKWKRTYVASFAFGKFMELFDRPSYLNRLKKWRDHDMIKVITDVRRAGKSTLLEIYRNWLEESGVSRDRMVAVNFEDPDVPEFSNWREAWNYLKSQLADTGRTYVFLDEIQRVPEFEKLVDGLHSRKTTDVYITGSNAYLLSGELATYLSGRYVEIMMQPLSFGAYCAALKVKSDFARHYVSYLKNSSFPYALSLGDDPTLVADYLDGIYNTVLVKDVLRRRRMADVGLVDRVARFLFDNIGNVSSLRGISGSLNALGAKTNANTVDGYVEALYDAFLFRKARRRVV